MFRYEKCSNQTVHCANHGQNMIVLSMIETFSRVSFNHDQTKHVQNVGWMRKGRESPNSAKAQNPASPSEIAKTQPNKSERYKLLSLSKMEYLVLTKAQVPCPR